MGYRGDDRGIDDAGWCSLAHAEVSLLETGCDALTRDGGGALFRIVLPMPVPPMSRIRPQADSAA